MDGNNRTAIIDVDNYDAILAFTLDYQAQVLYWILGDNSNQSQIIKRSNIDGTNQQTILQLRDEFYDYYYFFHHHYSFYSKTSLTVYNETLYLSSSWTSEVYKIGIHSENFNTLFINSSGQVFCRFQSSQLKVAKQPSG